MTRNEETKKRNHGHGSGNTSLSTSSERNLWNSFIKIMLPVTLHSKKLRIPEVFASAFGRELSTSATLTVPTGESWKVTLVEEDNQLLFQEGWQDLVEYFSIDCYYFLLFNYEGNSKFEVRIFDLTASEIYYPYTAPDGPKKEKKFHSADPGAGACNNNHDNSVRIPPKKQGLENNAGIHVEEIEIDIDDEPSLEGHEEQMDDDGNDVSRGRFSSSPLESDQEELDQYEGSKHSTEKNGYSEGTSYEDRVWYQDEELMKALASAGISRPKNPFFVIALKTYNLHKGNFVHIPGDFAREYITCEAGEYVKVETSYGRQWQMRCVRTDKLCRLGCGWMVFARDNDLKVGDVCAFELIDAKNHILKVHVAKMSKIKDAEEFF